MASDFDEKLIINNLKKGDILSFDHIFEKYHKKVYYFAISYLKNKEEAEDVVQEVFMNLWKYKDKINEYYVFSNYLFKIVYNATCKHFRKKASDRKHIEELLIDFTLEDNSTRFDIEYNDLIETVSIIIEKLPARQREIMKLIIEEKLNIEQVAIKLKITRKTVDNYVAMAKSSIIKSLSNRGILSVLFICLLIRLFIPN